MINALVVDDEIDICILLTQQLRNLGFQATYCVTIKAAGAQLLLNTYDLVFVDLNLTDGSGYDLIHTLRAFDRNAKIIVISAHESERQRVIEEGASFYVPKPFTRKSIRAALESLNLIERTDTTTTSGN